MLLLEASIVYSTIVYSMTSYDLECKISREIEKTSRKEQTRPQRSRAISVFNIHITHVYLIFARSEESNKRNCFSCYSYDNTMPYQCFSPIRMVGCILVRRPANIAKVSRPCFRVLAESLRVEREDTSLERMCYERKCKFRHGAK